MAAPPIRKVDRTLLRGLNRSEVCAFQGASVSCGGPGCQTRPVCCNDGECLALRLMRGKCCGRWGVRWARLPTLLGIKSAKPTRAAELGRCSLYHANPTAPAKQISISNQQLRGWEPRGRASTGRISPPRRTASAKRGYPVSKPPKRNRPPRGVRHHRQIERVERVHCRS